MYVIFFAGLIISCSRVISHDDIKEKDIFGSDRDIKKLKCLSIRSRLLRSLQGGVFLAVTLFILSSLTNMFTPASFWRGFIAYVMLFIITFILMIIINFLSVWNIISAHKVLSSREIGSNLYKIIILSISRKFILSSLTFLILIIITFIPSSSVVSYGYIDVAYRKGYISCISSEDGNFSKNGIPISYDSRGVHVFTGEYYPDESLRYYLYGQEAETGYRWRNVYREYLQFEKGYKVTSGACKSGSGMSSVPPPQGQ